MIDRRIRQPLPASRLAAGAVVVLALLAGIVLLAETLRHPLPGAPPDEPLLEPPADPRADVTCPPPQLQAPPVGERPAIAGPDEPVQVTSNALFDCPRSFDGRRVRYEGEAVGAVLERPGGAWVQLNDDVYAGDLGPLPAHRDYRGGNAGLGVFVPADLARQIANVGGPQSRGDHLEVFGVFHRVDPASHEVAVIRAESGLVTTPGGPFDDAPLQDRQVVAVVLGLLAGGLVAAERVTTRRR